jgi:hypothetical protein
MIVFCEECGQKNLLPAGISPEGRAVFQCSRCKYNNGYYLTDSPDTLTSAVVNALTQVQMGTPWMVGSFVFHPSKKIIFNRMPAALKLPDLEIMGTRLHKCFENGSRCFDGIETLTVKIGDKYLYAVCNTASTMLVLVTSGQYLPFEVQQKIGALFMRKDWKKKGDSDDSPH